MATLLDPPSPDEKTLLQVIAKAYDDADFCWPIWQYVSIMGSRAGIDALEVYKGMPRWEYGYRYVRVETQGGVGPADGATVQLTAAGMWHSRDDKMLTLFRVFLMMLGHAAWRQSGIEPKPREVVQESLDSHQFAAVVESLSRVAGRRTPLFDEQIQFLLLRAEPFTWGSAIGNGAMWGFHLNPERLDRFIDIDNAGGEAYLSELEELIGAPPAIELLTPVHPLALHEALDNLNLAWKLMTAKPLLLIRSVTGPGVLSQPANSRDEFERRCSALATLLEGFTTAIPGNSATKTKGKKSLQGLKDELVSLLGTQSDRATRAVDVLRDLVAVRNGQQHDDDRDAERARLSLGLARLAGDWPASWALIQNRLIDALRTIREELPV